jgi:hypothetical protein
MMEGRELLIEDVRPVLQGGRELTTDREREVDVRPLVSSAGRVRAGDRGGADT